MIVSTAPALEDSRIVVHAGLVPGEAAPRRRLVLTYYSTTL